MVGCEFSVGDGDGEEPFIVDIDGTGEGNKEFVVSIVVDDEVKEVEVIPTDGTGVVDIEGAGDGIDVPFAKQTSINNKTNS